MHASSGVNWAIILLLIGIALAVRACLSRLMEKAAIAKGYGKDSHVFLICFLFGLFGFLYVIALPDKILQSQHQQILAQLKEIERERR